MREKIYANGIGMMRNMWLFPRIWELNESIPHAAKIASLEKHREELRCISCAQIKVLSPIKCQIKIVGLIALDQFPSKYARAAMHIRRLHALRRAKFVVLHFIRNSRPAARNQRVTGYRNTHVPREHDSRLEELLIACQLSMSTASQ